MWRLIIKFIVRNYILDKRVWFDSTGSFTCESFKFLILQQFNCIFPSASLFGSLKSPPRLKLLLGQSFLIVLKQMSFFKCKDHAKFSPQTFAYTRLAADSHLFLHYSVRGTIGWELKFFALVGEDWICPSSLEGFLWQCYHRFGQRHDNYTLLVRVPFPVPWELWLGRNLRNFEGQATPYMLWDRIRF